MYFLQSYITIYWIKFQDLFGKYFNYFPIDSKQVKIPTNAIVIAFEGHFRGIGKSEKDDFLSKS